MFTLPSTLHLIYCLHHSCSVALCPDPADIVNGMVAFTGNSVGDTATYTCNSGFELIGIASVACTQLEVSSAAFSPAAPVCRREYYMIMNRLKRVLRCSVHCVILHCLHHSYIAALCPGPADIVNGTVTFIGNSVGDTATYNCNSGFELIGNASLTCTQLEVSSAVFSPAAPVCRREYYLIINRLKRGLRYNVRCVI